MQIFSASLVCFKKRKEWGNTMQDYTTTKGFATDEFVEKKSRFIGYSMPVNSEAAANDFIATISKKHRDATHNVHAFILRGGQIKRYSDNGEPQGTAGIPTLDVIQKSGIVDVCVVVTRYFGGILLGAGGLVRAYSHGASIALKSAEIVQMAACCNVQFECEYSFYGKLSFVFERYPMKLVDTDFGAAVTIKLIMKKGSIDEFVKEIVELSNGQVAVMVLDEIFCAL